MKMTELITEGIFDIDPKLVPFVKMGRKITAGLQAGSGVDWADDDQWNTAATLGRELTALGSEFGASTATDALKKAGVDIEEAKAIFALVKDVDPGDFSPEEPEDDEPEDDEPEDEEPEDFV